MTSGPTILAAIFALVLAALLGLLTASPLSGLDLNFTYVARILRFTFLQAALSTCLSLTLGAFLALALCRRNIPGRPLILAGLGVAATMPGIVLVFAIVVVFGRSGIVNESLAWMGLPKFSIYGLGGILLAHMFFNTAFAARIFLASLQSVPGEHWRLAGALAMPPWAIARWIDWPILRREVPSLGLLVFILCAVSFAVPLALGGGPAAATMEVAIFESLRFEADFARTALLALIQIAWMALLIALAAFFATRPPELPVVGRLFERADAGSGLLRMVDGVVLTVSGLLFLPPLAAVVWSARGLLTAVAGHETFKALVTSLGVAIPAAGLSLVIAIILVRSRNAFIETGHRRAASLIGFAPLLVAAVPPLAFAAGLFVLARQLGDPASIAVPSLIAINALMALPFVHRFVEPPLSIAAQRYGRLAASLALGSWARLRWVDAPLLKVPAAAGFATAMALSLGDLGVVALFGSSSLTTLPALLYQKLGAYRLADAESIAALLAVLVFALFIGAERLALHARRS